MESALQRRLLLPDQCGTRARVGERAIAVSHGWEDGTVVGRSRAEVEENPKVKAWEEVLEAVK